MCVNILPKVVTWQSPGPKSNLQSQGYEFGMLPLHNQATLDIFPLADCKVTGVP